MEPASNQYLIYTGGLDLPKTPWSYPNRSIDVELVTMSQIKSHLPVTPKWFSAVRFIDIVEFGCNGL